MVDVAVVGSSELVPESFVLTLVAVLVGSRKEHSFNVFLIMFTVFEVGYILPPTQNSFCLKVILFSALLLDFSSSKLETSCAKVRPFFQQLCLCLFALQQVMYLLNNGNAY